MLFKLRLLSCLVLVESSLVQVFVGIHRRFAFLFFDILLTRGAHRKGSGERLRRWIDKWVNDQLMEGVKIVLRRKQHGK